MLVDVSNELSKPVCQCSRCESEREAWQEWTKRPWLFSRVAKAQRDAAMYAISPGWCSECEVFNDCACGETAALTDRMECGSWNPCEEHIPAHKAWQEVHSSVPVLISEEQELLAQEWESLRTFAGYLDRLRAIELPATLQTKAEWEALLRKDKWETLLREESK